MVVAQFADPVHAVRVEIWLKVLSCSRNSAVSGKAIEALVYGTGTQVNTVMDHHAVHAKTRFKIGHCVV